MTPHTWLPFRNCFQHRALVPSYLVIWAGAKSLCLCAEGREGWQDKAALPWGALISFFRPRCFPCSLQIPPWSHLPTEGRFLEKGVPQHCLGPPFLLQHSSFISSCAPNTAEEMLCGVPWASLVTACERNDNIPAHWSWQPPSCRGPVAVFSYLRGARGLAVPVQIWSTLLLAQLQELGGQCHPRCHWRRGEKDYHGHFTLQQSKTCQPRGEYLPWRNKRGWRGAVGK